MQSKKQRQRETQNAESNFVICLFTAHRKTGNSKKKDKKQAKKCHFGSFYKICNTSKSKASKIYDFNQKNVSQKHGLSATLVLSIIYDSQFIGKKKMQFFLCV